MKHRKLSTKADSKKKVGFNLTSSRGLGAKLSALIARHQKLKERIALIQNQSVRLMGEEGVLQKLKLMKLRLKDKIAFVERSLGGSLEKAA
jgi:uncharacterized protein YdcH (DUF465 family)